MSRRTPLLAALLFLALGAFAQTARVPPLYRAASGPWTGAVGAALKTAPGAALPASLVPLTGAGVIPAAAYAPVVAHLETGLKLTPAAFAELPPAERHAALELAVESARDELTQKAAALAAEARALSAPDKPLDKDGRSALYRVVAHLDEMRTRYGPLLGANAGPVEEAYTHASARAWLIRNALLGKSAEDLSAEFARAGRDAPAPPAAAGPPVLPPGSDYAVKLYADMKASKNGWGADDIDALLVGFGFERRNGGKHRVYTHPDYPDLRQTVSHQRSLPPGYAQSAVKAVEELGRRRAAARAPAASSARGGVPAAITLDDLAVLLSAPDAPKARSPEPQPSAAPPAAKPAAKTAAKAATRPGTPVSVPVEVRAVPPAPAAKDELPAPEAANAAAPSRLRRWLRGLFGARSTL